MKLNKQIFSNLLIRKIFLTGAILVLTFGSVFSQEYMTEISNAMKQGNVKAMSKYFDAKVEISFFENSKSYSKEKAIQVLQQFFFKTEPKSYISLQKGNSSSNKSKFHIGSLGTSNGSYKVYMLFVLKEGNYFLKELRFEK